MSGHLAARQRWCGCDRQGSDISPLTFSDYDAAVDWAEREHDNLLQAVRTAADAGHDRLAWQLSTVLWNAQFPSASGTSWPTASRGWCRYRSDLDDGDVPPAKCSEVLGI
ncbi:hypothetical protein GCM10009577_70710 [Streptomyces javensis]